MNRRIDMCEKTKYYGVVKHENEILYTKDDNSFSKLMADLLCTIENEYHSATGQIFRKNSGEIIYQCRRAAIC